MELPTLFLFLLGDHNMALAGRWVNGAYLQV